MKATRLFYDKALLPDGSTVEMSIWRLPELDPERPHGLKYSLYFGRLGLRIVAYDNERGKGDHKHVEGTELPYRFVSIERLVADFILDVEQARGRFRHEEASKGELP
jgi:hypothetical protein